MIYFENGIDEIVRLSVNKIILKLNFLEMEFMSVNQTSNDINPIFEK